MENIKRIEISSVTLLLYVAIVTSARTILENVDKAFATWLTVFYCIDVFLFVLYFIFVECGCFLPGSKFYKFNEILFKIGDYCLLPNLFLVNCVFAYFILSAYVPSVRQVWLLNLYGTLIGANLYFGLFFVLVPVIGFLFYVLYRLFYRLFCWISFYF